MLYEISKPTNRFGSQLQYSSLGAPEGFAISTQMAELLKDLTSQLVLRDAGVLTPWGERKSDLEWIEISKPDTNISTFEITDADISAAQESVLFGQRLPFLAVVTGQLQPNAQLQQILEGSPYEWFETLAVYRQDDSQAVPNVLFLHWLRVRQEEDIERKSKKMSVVADEMLGRLMFAQQVPVDSTTLRAPPTVSFAQAFGVQEPDPLFNPTVQPAPDLVSPLPSVPAVQPTQSAQPVEVKKAGVFAGSNLALPVTVGVALAFATVFLVRKAGKK